MIIRKAVANLKKNFAHDLPGKLTSGSLFIALNKHGPQHKHSTYPVLPNTPRPDPGTWLEYIYGPLRGKAIVKLKCPPT